MLSPAGSGRRGRIALVPLLFLILGAVVVAVALASPARDRVAALPAFTGTKIGDFPAKYGARRAITEVADPLGSGEKVLKLTVSDGDVFPITPTDNPRAELVSPDIVRPGMNVWLSTKFLVPTSYPRIRSGGWVSLISFYGPPFDGPSPWRLELAGNGLQWERNSTYDFDVPFREPLARGRWTSVLVHERFATEGFVEMWINGRRVDFFSSGGFNPHRHGTTRRLRMATVDHSNDGGPNSARIAQYREAGMFSRGTIYFGALRVGPTRASVAP